MNYMKLTRQGVRDLNDKPSNRRRASQRRLCFHEWEHEWKCVNCRFSTGVACEQYCRRCGLVRT